jgi:putative phosphoesterase
MEPATAPLARLGLIADTRVPDRNSSLSPAVLEVFSSAGIRMILHAGDISCKAVLDQLAEIAPVKAVGGNRDLMIRPALPSRLEFQVEGVRVALAHGHGGWGRYITNKMLHFRDGYRFEIYQRFLARQFPNADVIVFGHTHRAINLRLDGRLYLNPGAAFPCRVNGFITQCGLLNIYANGSVEGEIITL